MVGVFGFIIVLPVDGRGDMSRVVALLYSMLKYAQSILERIGAGELLRTLCRAMTGCDTSSTSNRESTRSPTRRRRARAVTSKDMHIQISRSSEGPTQL